jgi:hypothetical protein
MLQELELEVWLLFEEWNVCGLLYVENVKQGLDLLHEL